MAVFPPDKSRANLIHPAYKRIDWSIIDTIDDVTTCLIGDTSYWQNEEFENKSPLEIELKILRIVDQYEWHRAKPYGKPMWEHLCCLMKLLNPTKTDILTGLYDTAQAFCILMGTNGFVLNQLGARSMSKTGGDVRFMNALMTIKPEKSMMFVGCPYDNVADTGAWGDYQDIASDMVDNHPWLFPDYKDYKTKVIQYGKYPGKFGKAIARTPSDVSKYKGTKGHQSGDGFIIIFNEEINEHPRSGYFQIEENLTSNRQFFFFNAWNWRTNEDLGAMVSRPDEERSGMREHSDIDIDNDDAYDCIGEGITLRFDGLKSVNMLAGKTLTNYTFFNETDLAYLKKRYGEEHPTFKSQARAYPDGKSSANTVLNMQDGL